MIFPTDKLSAFALLSKGCLRRDFGRAPMHASGTILLPPPSSPWSRSSNRCGGTKKSLRLAAGGAVWLLLPTRELRRDDAVA